MVRWLPVFVGQRYASLRTRNLLVGFISTLSICGLSLSVAILITVLSVMNGFDRELRERILGVLPHITASTLPGYPLLEAGEWLERLPRIESVPGVAGAALQVRQQGMLLGGGRSRGVLVSGVVPEQEREVSILNQFMTAGSLDALKPGDYRILLGATLAESLGAGVGDRVTLVSTEVPITILGGFPRRKPFTVAGIFRVGSQLDGNLAMAHIEDIQTLYRLDGRVQGVRIQVNDLFAVNDVGEALQSALPPNTGLRFWTSDFGNIYENIRLSKTLVGLLLFLLVAVAAFNVVVSLFMVVKDKQGDIAILRAMGASLQTIRNIFLVQGFIIGLIGTATGLVLGIFFSLTISDFAAWLEGIMGIELLSADIYPVNYLPSQVQAGDLLLVCGAALLLSLLATIYPALSAARVRPAEVLRYE